MNKNLHKKPDIVSCLIIYSFQDPIEPSKDFFGGVKPRSSFYSLQSVELSLV